MTRPIPPRQCRQVPPQNDHVRHADIADAHPAVVDRERNISLITGRRLIDARDLPGRRRANVPASVSMVKSSSGFFVADNIRGDSARRCRTSGLRAVAVDDPHFVVSLRRLIQTKARRADPSVRSQAFMASFYNYPGAASMTIKSFPPLAIFVKFIFSYFVHHGRILNCP